jgi:hypothetical protein
MFTTHGLVTFVPPTPLMQVLTLSFILWMSSRSSLAPSCCTFYPEYGAKYVNNTEYFNEIKAHTLDASLLEAALKTGRTPVAGDVKMMYYTKVGPGPQSLPMSEANLDPTTGLNTYVP